MLLGLLRLPEEYPEAVEVSSGMVGSPFVFSLIFCLIISLKGWSLSSSKISRFSDLVRPLLPPNLACS